MDQKAATSTAKIVTPLEAKVTSAPATLVELDPVPAEDDLLPFFLAAFTGVVAFGPERFKANDRARDSKWAEIWTLAQEAKKRYEQGPK